ncbi:macro domain-containing protein [Nitrospira sp. M1]
MGQPLMTLPKTCFVIMPFGKKLDVNKKEVNFDEVYLRIFKEAIEELGLQCIRCDEIEKAGSIHGDMFEYILESGVVLVDITTLNANVFYELGIRHTLKNAVTVLVRQKGTHAPFNIKGLRVISYDPDDLKNIQVTRKSIQSFIDNGMKSNHTDSPVHKVLNIRISTDPKPIHKCEVYEYPLRAISQKRLGLITGDIQNIRGIDGWVNSENTNMQMARFFDRSISSVIRYLGAKKHQTGHVVEDTIADELSRIMEHYTHVPPTTVIATEAGELEATHGVKKVFHVASVEGVLGQGYCPIRNVEACVTTVLQKANSTEYSSLNLRSLLFPIIGAGTGMGNLSNTAERLFHAAIAYLESHPSCAIDRVYFLTWSKNELEVCQKVLMSVEQVMHEEQIATFDSLKTNGTLAPLRSEKVRKKISLTRKKSAKV